MRHVNKRKKENEVMKCSKCGSENVSVQAVNTVELVKKHHSIFYWIFIGWWWFFIKWIVFTLPAILFAIFGKKKVAVNKIVTQCVCQDCGNNWTIEQ